MPLFIWVSTVEWKVNLIVQSCRLFFRLGPFQIEPLPPCYSSYLVYIRTRSLLSEEGRAGGSVPTLYMNDLAYDEFHHIKIPSGRAWSDTVTRRDLNVVGYVVSQVVTVWSGHFAARPPPGPLQQASGYVYSDKV